MILFVILLSMLIILLSNLSVIRHLICGNNSNSLLNLNLIYKTLWIGIGNSLLISMLEKRKWFCLTSLITMMLLMWKWMCLFLRKNHLLRWWGWLSLLNWIKALTLSVLLKLLQENWILEKSLDSFYEVSLSWVCSIKPCMKYCCHVCAGGPSCCSELIEKLQKQICRTVGPSLAASLEPLTHCQNLASLSLFFRIA